MKSLYLLTIVFSLTYASTVGHHRSHLHNNDIQRRFDGNRPGERGYDYHDDPMWNGGRGGRYGSDNLMELDENRRRDDRNPPEDFSPEREPRTRRESTNTGYRDGHERRPVRDQQLRDIVRDAKPALVIGKQWPKPKQGPQLYLKGGVGATADADTLTPRGRVTVSTFESAGLKVGAGNYFVDASLNMKQDLNAPPERPQPVTNPIPGRQNTYYMKTRDGGSRPVFLGRDGHFYSRNTGEKRIHGRPDVYIGDPSVKRSTVLGTIETTTNAPNNSSVSLSAVWQEYWNIYSGLRTNATNLLMPVFNDLVSKSNTSYAYEMAWSIHSQLTGSPNEYLDGPYLNGLTNFDDFTDNWLLDAGFWLDGSGTIYVPDNATFSNDTFQQTAKVLSVNNWLQTTYYETWNASVAAINVTQPGSTHTLLDDLVYYAAVVTATNDTSLMSENFYTLDLPTAAEEAAWFLNGINEYY